MFAILFGVMLGRMGERGKPIVHFCDCLVEVTMRLFTIFLWSVYFTLHHISLVSPLYTLPYFSGQSILHFTIFLWSVYFTFHHISLVSLFYISPYFFGQSILHFTIFLWSVYFTFHHISLVSLFYISPYFSDQSDFTLSLSTMLTFWHGSLHV